jgi:Holliday junction resolvasome RuvABC endonuclease subunit
MIGIDPGTKNIGVAIDSSNYKTFVKSGYGKDGLIALVKDVVSYLLSFNDRHLLFEDYAHGGMFNKEEAEVMGIFYTLLSMNGQWEISLIPITTNKKIITGNGRASKVEVIKCICDYYGINTKVSHECDALGLLITASRIDLAGKTFKLGG